MNHDRNPNLIQILSELRQAPAESRSILHKHGLSPKRFIDACQGAGGMDVLEAKRLLSSSYSMRKSMQVT